ncbi:MAG: hypothetical protein RMJ84_04520 [Sandaracinaceae bacterium]|nr:hypothetical protein [Sandaracinaceae bacterium]
MSGQEIGRRTLLRGLLGSASVFFVGGACSSSPRPPSGLVIPRGQAVEGWPRTLITLPGKGPAIFAGHEEEAPPFGHLGFGLRARVEGEPKGQRIPVTIGGSFIVRGWVPLHRLAACTLRRGRISGTPIYVGANDPVSIISSEGESYRIIVRPRFGRVELDEDADGYSGVIPANWVGEGDASAPDPGLNQGQPMQLPGWEVELYDRPGGQVVARIPTADPPLTVIVLKDQGEWKGVRVGVGPFLVGFVNVPLTPSSVEAVGERPKRPEPSNEMPFRIANEAGPLHRVAAGTRVFFYGEAVGTLKRDGWAREVSGRRGDQVDVYLAVDDGVAIRGLVPVSSLQPVEGATASRS